MNNFSIFDINFFEKNQKSIIKSSFKKKDKIVITKFLNFFKLNTNLLIISEEQTRKVCTLEELVRRFEKNVSKLEAENASLKTHPQPTTRSSLNQSKSISISSTVEDSVKISSLQQRIEELELELKTCKEDAASDRQAAKQAQLSLWKKEKELSNANLDKRIATREAESAEKKIKTLQEEKQRLLERLNNRVKEEEEKAKKATKELETVKSSLADLTKDVSRNKLQADSAQRVSYLFYLNKIF